MSPFKMGFKNLFVFTALLLIWKVCRVYGQTARVEYITQPCTSSVATTVQATPQLVVPAIYSPVISPYDSCIQESVPTVPSYNGFNGYSNYVPSYPQPMPPIIIEEDSNNSRQPMLYFLLFAMRNKRNRGSGNFGCGSGGCNGGCGCGGGCNCGCGGCNCCCGGCNCCCGGCNCCCGGCNCCCGGCNCGCGGCKGGCGGKKGGHNGGGGGGYDNSGFGGCGNCCGCCSYIPYPIPYPTNGPYPCSFPSFGGYSDNSYGSTEEPYQPGQGSNDINIYLRTDPACTC